jgi:hypothetical protein
MNAASVFSSAVRLMPQGWGIAALLRKMNLEP